MTLNKKIKVFINFLAILGCETIQKRIAPKSLQIDHDKLHMKFSALNVNFNGPSLDLLNSRKPAHESIKKQYPLKSLVYRCWPV